MEGKILEWQSNMYGDVDRRTSELDIKMTSMYSKVEILTTEVDPTTKKKFARLSIISLVAEYVSLMLLERKKGAALTSPRLPLPSHQRFGRSKKIARLMAERGGLHVGGEYCLYEGIFKQHQGMVDGAIRSLAYKERVVVVVSWEGSSYQHGMERKQVVPFTSAFKSLHLIMLPSAFCSRNLK
eukprot:Gb_20188 [translate_table: standard]